MKMKVFQNIRDNITLPPLISRDESPQYQSFISKFTLVIIFIFASNVYISVFFFDDYALMMAKFLEEYSALFAKRIEYLKLLDDSSHKYYAVTLFWGSLLFPVNFIVVLAAYCYFLLPTQRKSIPHRNTIFGILFLSVLIFLISAFVIFFTPSEHAARPLGMMRIILWPIFPIIGILSFFSMSTSMFLIFVCALRLFVSGEDRNGLQ